MSEAADECPPGDRAAQTRMLGRIISRLRDWAGGKRFRRAVKPVSQRLPSLSDRMLDDIGIDRAAAEVEEMRADPGAARMESLAKKKYLAKLW